MAAVRALVAAEMAERENCLVAFAPLMPLCVARPTKDGRPSFPPRAMSLIWRALAARDSTLTYAVEQVRNHWGEEPPPIDPIDAACRTAAVALREGAPDFAEATAMLNRAGPDGALEFAGYLDLAPLTRALLPRLSDWLGRMTSERVAAARLVYKDAVAIADDAGPRLFEIIYAHLEPPWLILRVVSAVMDRPGDRYMADSELGLFGERVLDEIERRSAVVARFDPAGGIMAGIEAGEALMVASAAINEFVHTLDLTPTGPWTGRIRKLKAALAKTVENRLRDVDDAVGAALPLQAAGFGVRLMRGAPRLTEDPDPRLVAKASGLLSFFELTRSTADQGGYGVARAKAAEKLNARLDQYIEDLLEGLRAEDGTDHARIRAYLEVAADFMGAASGEKAAQIVRRRIAAV